MLEVFGPQSLFGARFGTRTPWLLALHGWQRTHLDFSAVISDGIEPLDAIALDLPGFGATPAPDSGWSTERYAQSVATVLPLMTDKVVVLGHSFGAIVAAQLAVTAPDHIAAIVLTGAPLFRPKGARTKPALQYRLLRSLAKSGVVSERRLEAAREHYGSSDYRNAKGVVREVLVQRLSEDYTDLLSSITVPVELVVGENDTAAPPSVATRAAALIANANVTIVPGVDHFTPTHIPDVLRDAVLRHQP